MNSVNRRPLPSRIERLSELAFDLWWSWNAVARDVFRDLDYPLWRFTDHMMIMVDHQKKQFSQINFDEFMKQNGMPTPGEMHQIAPQKLHRVFGADAILYLVIEKWESMDSLKAHAAAPHMAAYGAKTKEFIATRVIHILSPA